MEGWTARGCRSGGSGSSVVVRLLLGRVGDGVCLCWRGRLLPRRWLCLPGGMGCLCDGPWRWWRVSGRKSSLTTSVPTAAALEGVVFPLGGVVVPNNPPSITLGRKLKSGLPDWLTAVSFDVVTSLEASIFGGLEASLGVASATGRVDVFGYRRRASAASLFHCGLPLAMKLERPSRSFRLCLPFQGRGPGNRSASCCRRAGVVVGAPDLVKLGSVAMCAVFCRFFLKNCAVFGFSCLVSLINRTRVF